MGAIFLLGRAGGGGRCGKAPQASQARPAPHCVGRLLRGRSPRKKPPLTGEVAERQRWPEGLWRFAAAGSCGGVKTPPYGAKDTWAVMARLRAGHARPLRTAVKIYAREGQGRAAALPLCSGRGLPGNGWRRKARRNPSGLASSASSPDGEPFAGCRPRWRASVTCCGGSGEHPNLKWRKGRGR